MAGEPTFAGFVTFVYEVMGVPQAALPAASQTMADAYEVAVALVNPQLKGVPGPIYRLCVYNLGGDYIINWAPDTGGYLYPTDNPDGLGYFAFLRKQWNITGFVPGVVIATADEGTSESLEVPEQLKELTIANLQNLKTPWGRAYLGYAQSVGTLWGIS